VIISSNGLNQLTSVMKVQFNLNLEGRQNSIKLYRNRSRVTWLIGE